MIIISREMIDQFELIASEIVIDPKLTPERRKEAEYRRDVTHLWCRALRSGNANQEFAMLMRATSYLIAMLCVCANDPKEMVDVVSNRSLEAYEDLLKIAKRERYRE